MGGVRDFPKVTYIREAELGLEVDLPNSAKYADSKAQETLSGDGLQGGHPQTCSSPYLHWSFRPGDFATCVPASVQILHYFLFQAPPLLEAPPPGFSVHVAMAHFFFLFLFFKLQFTSWLVRVRGLSASL